MSISSSPPSFTASANLVTPSTTITSASPNPTNNITNCSLNIPQALYLFNDTGCGTSDAPFNSITYAALTACCEVHLLPYDVPVSMSGAGATGAHGNRTDGEGGGEVTVGAYCPLAANVAGLGEAFAEYMECVQANMPCMGVVCGAVVMSNVTVDKTSMAARGSLQSLRWWKARIGLVVLYAVTTFGLVP